MSKGSDAKASSLAPHDDATDLVPVEFVAQYLVLPLQIHEDSLRVAVAVPECLESLDAVREATGFSKLLVEAAPPAAFRTWLQDNHQCRSALEEVLASEVQVSIEGDTGKSDDAQKLLHALIAACRCRGASRVIAECMSARARARVRVGERLETVLLYSHELHHGLHARLAKLLDDAPAGSLAVTVADKPMHLHCSIVPTILGHTISLQLKNPHLCSLEELAFSPVQIDVLEDCLAQPSGLIILAGRQGSGLTATALALAEKLLSMQRLTYMVSTDICRPLRQLSQVAIRADLPIDQQLRAVMQHQPDALIMDLPGSSVAFKEAVRAAMSGCLVVLTCNYSRATDVLLSDQVSGYSMASTALCVVAQHLFRKVCDGCAKGYEPEEALLRELGIPKPAAARGKFRQGKGCSACYDSGFDGLVAARELLQVDADLRPLIRDGATGHALLEHARENGFYTLMENAVMAVMKGETTVEEIRAGLN
jgi:type IV pilus assembly protein PilB